MHTNEDLGKPFQDANGQLSGSHGSASRVQGYGEKRRKLGCHSGKAMPTDTRSSLISVAFLNSLHEKKTPTNRGKEGRKGFLL